ncbi:unnamed protein product, partial [Anisakis simplex]|uniref:CsbD family protein n=1 Tax=Anisakis simplex TaxID=6269 RepID=A0A0M3JNM6_ANISI
SGWTNAHETRSKEDSKERGEAGENSIGRGQVEEDSKGTDGRTGGWIGRTNQGRNSKGLRAGANTASQEIARAHDSGKKFGNNSSQGSFGGEI